MDRRRANRDEGLLEARGGEAYVKGCKGTAKVASFKSRTESQVVDGAGE